MEAFGLTNFKETVPKDTSVNKLALLCGVLKNREATFVNCFPLNLTNNNDNNDILFIEYLLGAGF